MLSPRFSSSSRSALARARALARVRAATSKNRSEFTGTAHLLLALLEEFPQGDDDDETQTDRIGALLLLSGISRAEARLYAEAALATEEKRSEKDSYSFALERVVLWACTRTYAEIIEPEHLFIALSRPQKEPHVGTVMRSLGLEAAQLEAHLRQIECDEAPAGRPLLMLDKRAKFALQAAHKAMRANGCGRISTLHLLIGLLETRAPIRVFLEKQGINMDELRAVAAVGARFNDGEIGGPQIQLAPDAKRAIERAKMLAIKNQLNDPQSRIAPEHLWMALLPHAATTREKLRWGGELNDPLAEVWKRFDSAPLKDALRIYLINSALSSPSASQMKLPTAAEKINKIHLDWLWVMAGISYHLVWILFGLQMGGVLMIMATLFGIALTFVGVATRSRPLRDGAASFLSGLIAGIFVTCLVRTTLNIR